MAIEIGIRTIKCDEKIGRYGGALFKIGEIESTLRDVVDNIESLDCLVKTTRDITMELDDVQMWFSDVLEDKSFYEKGFEEEFYDMKKEIEDLILAVEQVRETLEEAL